MADRDSQQDATTERRRRRGDRNVFGLVLIGLGTVWFLSETHLLALSAETILSVLLILLALGLIYTARWGRKMGRWPILLGMGLTIALIANSPSLHIRVRGGFGDQTITPMAASELAPFYDGGFGNLNLDLTQIPPADLENQHIRIRMGGGNVAVTVPPGIAVDVVGHVRIGHLAACGQELSQGFGGTERHFDSAPNAIAHLWLVINAGVGEVSVTGCESGTTPPTAPTATSAPTAPTAPTPPTVPRSPA